MFNSCVEKPVYALDESRRAPCWPKVELGDADIAREFDQPDNCCPDARWRDLMGIMVVHTVRDGAGCDDSDVNPAGSIFEP